MIMTGNARQESILIASDAADNRELLSQALEQRYRIVEAAAGSDAVAKLHSEGPVDLILLDILMPDRESLQLCRDLQETDKDSEIPIIILSATHREKDIVKAFSAGAADYIRKPYRLAIVKERIESQLELIRARNGSELANKAKSAFLANMSHEIRTPLSAIIGMNRLALESEKREEQLYYGHIVQESAESLLGLLNDILDFSKIEAGHLELDQHSFNLGHILESVIHSLELKAREKGIDLSWSLAPELELNCSGASLRLRQVLFNLLQNAIKFTSEGSVTVKVEPHGTTDEQCFHFAVTDTGPGIPHEQQEKVFSAFCQVDGSNSRQFGGTGLGLSITRQLVQLMGGKIWLESSPGQGSTFHFQLSFPRATEEELPSPHTGSAPALSHGREAEGPPAGELLLVEDEKFNRILAKALFEREGYVVTEAENGLKALGELNRHRFDLIVMDIQMPELDGLRTSRLIRSCEQGRTETSADRSYLPEGLARRLKDSYTPIIALTANAIMTDDQKDSLARDMDMYLTKPILPEKLREVLDHFETRPGRGMEI